MNEEQHIIKFKYNMDLYHKIVRKNGGYINAYQLPKDIIYGYCISIYYNNLYIYKLDIDIDRDYIFNLSNMLYKLHTKDYYSRIRWNKELI